MTCYTFASYWPFRDLHEGNRRIFLANQIVVCVSLCGFEKKHKELFAARKWWISACCVKWVSQKTNVWAFQKRKNTFSDQKRNQLNFFFPLGFTHDKNKNKKLKKKEIFQKNIFKKCKNSLNLKRFVSSWIYLFSRMKKPQEHKQNVLAKLLFSPNSFDQTFWKWITRNK